MDPLAVAAQFAAYAWFTETHPDKTSTAAAMSYARRNWPAFIGQAPEGLGRLLLRVGGLTTRRRRRNLRRPMSMATAG